MPERTTVTSGWFHTQRRAHSAGVRRVFASFQISATAGGGVARPRFPPAQGFHDDYTQVLRGGIFQARRAGLVLLVQEVVLDWQNSHASLPLPSSLFRPSPTMLPPATKNRIYVEWVKMTAILVGSF